MGRLLTLALLLQSCATPASSIYDAGGMVLVLIHADDTLVEQNDYLTRRIGRSEKWCRQGETDQCARVQQLKKERAEVQKQLSAKNE